MSDTATPGFVVDIFGGGRPNPRNIRPLKTAPTRRHRLPAPAKPSQGFVLGENAQSGVTRRNGGKPGGHKY